MLHGQPTLSVAEVLKGLAKCEVDLVRKWVGNAIQSQQNQTDDLFRQIEAMCVKSENDHINSLIEQYGLSQDTMGLDDSPDAPSVHNVQQVQHYVSLHSIKKHEFSCNLNSDDKVFDSLDSFIAHWGFKGPKQVLALPLDPPNPPVEGDSIASTIAVTSPSHLYCIYHTHKSIRHEWDGVWEAVVSCDGKGKLYRAGKPVIITVGRHVLHINRDGKAVRSFLPLLHVLSESENGAALSAALRAFRSAVSHHTGITFKPGFSITDMSRALVRGFKDVFPNCNTCIDREHLRAAPLKAWSSKIPFKRQQKKIVISNKSP